MILDKFPSTEDFYKTYWNKKPFVVRSAIPTETFDHLIDGDTLAGLSLEEDIKSRLVITEPSGDKWTCHHGPLEEDRFERLGDNNWSLLVQNVEQYHTDTADLLKSFHFSPRWLLDDIMVSYSAPGGSVGPHTDSYHVFLVQGMGKRTWKIGNTPIEKEECIDGLDLKVLKNGFDGETVDVSMGDVIYIPPHFAHEGTTTEESMTFSVGFLGPQLSELFVEYGHYLEQRDEINKRYSGQGLNAESAAFTITPHAQNTIQNNLITALQSENFSIWMAEYFSTPTHDDIENLETCDTPLSSEEILTELKNGQTLHKPEHIKLTITTSSSGKPNLAVHGACIPTTLDHNELIHQLNENNSITIENLGTLGDQNTLMPLITELYNKNILFLT